MDAGKKFILALAVGPPIVIGAFLFLFLDYYIPSARLEAAVQGVSAQRAGYAMEKVLHGCRARYSAHSRYRQYRAGSIGRHDRSFPSIRNDKGWLAGTRVRCDETGCTVTSSALISSPRESGSCDDWSSFRTKAPDARPGA